MKKIKLDVETLTVESFETRESAEAVKGTVRGHEDFTGYSECDCGSSPYYSQCCTGDPRDFQCYDSFHYCLETQRQICAETDW